MSVCWAAVETLVISVELRKVRVPILSSRLTVEEVLSVPAISLIPVNVKHSEAGSKQESIKSHLFVTSVAES